MILPSTGAARVLPAWRIVNANQAFKHYRDAVIPKSAFDLLRAQPRRSPHTFFQENIGGIDFIDWCQFSFLSPWRGRCDGWTEFILPCPTMINRWLHCLLRLKSSRLPDILCPSAFVTVSFWYCYYQFGCRVFHRGIRLVLQDKHAGRRSNW